MPPLRGSCLREFTAKKSPPVVPESNDVRGLTRCPDPASRQHAVELGRLSARRHRAAILEDPRTDSAVMVPLVCKFARPPSLTRGQGSRDFDQLWHPFTSPPSPTAASRSAHAPRDHRMPTAVRCETLSRLFYPVPRLYRIAAEVSVGHSSPWQICTTMAPTLSASPRCWLSAPTRLTAARAPLTSSSSLCFAYPNPGQSGRPSYGWAGASTGARSSRRATR